MGLKEVVDSILAEGRREAEKAVADARSRAGDVVRDAEKRAAAAVAARSSEGKRQAEALRKREVASAELEAKKARLNAEKELLAAVRSAVEEKLASLPEDARRRHLQVLFERGGGKEGRVLVAKRDGALAERLGLAVTGTFDGLGGMAVESRDGATREDLRYESLLDEVWRDAVHDVAQKILPREGA